MPCDIFLSYSWADDPVGPAGLDWVRQFRSLLEHDLRPRLGRSPAIFLDQADMPDGPVTESLCARLEEATVFVAVVSDAWLRPGTWCPWELAHFRNCASLHAEQPDSRIKKVVIAPPAAGAELPGALSQSPEYRFYGFMGRDRADFSRTFPIPVSELPASAEYARLLQNLEKTLKSPAPASKGQPAVYVAADPGAQGDRLRTELRQRNIRPLREIPWPNASFPQFRERVGRRMQTAGATIHLLSPHTTPADWDRTPDLIELEKAIEFREAGRGPLRVFLWSDLAPERLASFAPLIERGGRLHGLDNLVGKTWEYTLSNIPTTMGRTPDIDDGLLSPPGGRKQVFLQCVEKDRLFARAVRDKLARDGHVVIFLPQPDGWIARKKRTGEDQLRFTRYARFYRESDGVLVLYGKSGDLWTQITCDEIRELLANDLDAKVPGAYLAPPEEEKDFTDSDFPNYQYSTLDEYSRRLAEGNE